MEYCVNNPSGKSAMKAYLLVGCNTIRVDDSLECFGKLVGTMERWRLDMCRRREDMQEWWNGCSYRIVEYQFSNIDCGITHQTCPGHA